MAFEITKVDVWVGSVDDLPGVLAEKLEVLQRAGASLDFVIARPVENQPCASVLYVAPLHGEEQVEAAARVGLRKSNIHNLRVAGPNHPGLLATIARTLADAGINIAGISASRLGERAIIYLRYETEENADQAADVLTATLT